MDIAGLERVAEEVLGRAYDSIDCLFSEVSDKYGSAHRIVIYFRAQLQNRRPNLAIRYIPRPLPAAPQPVYHHVTIDLL